MASLLELMDLHDLRSRVPWWLQIQPLMHISVEELDTKTHACYSFSFFFGLIALSSMEPSNFCRSHGDLSLSKNSMKSIMKLSNKCQSTAYLLFVLFLLFLFLLLLRFRHHRVLCILLFIRLLWTQNTGVNNSMLTKICRYKIWYNVDAPHSLQK